MKLEGSADPRVASLGLLGGLIRRGRVLLDRHTPAEVRIWQHDCAAAVNELSGGSKAHWLSRAYSGALLMRSADGAALVEASVADIVRRVLDVLEQARRSIETMDTAAPLAGSDGRHVQSARFDFVHDPELRPVLDQAFVDSQRAFDERDYARAMQTTCGILEAIITDALAHGRSAGLSGPRPAPAALKGPRYADMCFADRIAAAERAGVIRGSCARLPAAARVYRDPDPPSDISERDAAVTRQVLRVVMRDLDPGR